MKIRNSLLKVLFTLISSMPFGILYITSDFLSFSMQHIIRYQRDVINQNLTLTFPKKSPSEIKLSLKRYYRNLCDLISVTIKLSKMTTEQIEERVIINNQKLFDKIYYQSKSVLAALGHCENGEWIGNKIALYLKHEDRAVYNLMIGCGRTIGGRIFREKKGHE